MIPPKSLIISFLVCSLCILFSTDYIQGQNLENIGGKLFQVSGNISVGNSFYKAIDRDNRRSPFAYFINANPTFSIYGLDVPVSITYRDQQGSISNPFNRYSINPTYKWASLHLGNISLQMNPYTLSGVNFKGAGLEVNPGKLRFAVAAGELENPLAQLDTIIEGAELLETYKRDAVAVKLGYGSANNFLEFSGFRAKDDIEQVNVELLNTRLVKPEENIVLGTSFKISPLRWFSIHANIAASAHTANQGSLDILTTPDLEKAQEDYGDKFTLNVSSKLQLAGDAGFDFKFSNFGFGGEYKRVDPFYKSLGTYYFLEDYENLLMKANISIFKNRVRFAGRGGIQRNNLNGLRTTTNTRQIASGNLTLSPSRNFSLTARYSNFVNESSQGVVEINDSLRYTRTTAIYGVSPRYTFGSKSMQSTLIASANYQNLEDLLDNRNTGRSIDNYTGNLTYNLNLRERQAQIALSLLGNQNLLLNKETQRIGCSLRFTKKLMDKKLSVTSTGGYTKNYLNQLNDGTSVTLRFGLRYRIKRKYTAAININYLNRNGGSRVFQEYRSSMRFTYIFPRKGSNNN